MVIDHIGYAVKRMDRALVSFGKLGYRFESVVDDTDRNVQIAFGEKDGYRIELISPLDKAQPSPVQNYLKNVGNTPYHICYRTEDLESEIRDLTGRGFRVVIEPRPATAFGGKRVVFMMDLAMGLLEIVEA